MAQEQTITKEIYVNSEIQEMADLYDSSKGSNIKS